MELAKHLFDKGANVNSLDKDGTTILLDQVRELGWRGISAGKGEKFRERIEFLLKHGANTEARLDGQTPFHLIMRYQLPYFEFAQLLLDYGADVNALRPDGETELHAAVRERNVQKIAFLVRNSAQILPNADGETPIDLARNFPEILKCLEMTPIA